MAAAASTHTSVTVSGPLLTGMGPVLAQAFLSEATYVVAGQVLADVHLVLNQSIKHPTPYYETQIMMERKGVNMIVHDRGIVYGPWLEGTSHRNQTTRFKGYAAFRKATATAQQKAGLLVAPILAKYLRRLG